MRVVQLLALCALMPALANRAESGATGAIGTWCGPHAWAASSAELLCGPGAARRGQHLPPRRLSLAGGGDQDANDEIRMLRSAMEEMKRRRRTASPTSARGRPAFNATADREMRARKLIEELRIRRHERFDQGRDGPAHGRSRSAPSPGRPWPTTASQSSAGIAQFAGSGGWSLNSTVSHRIWAAETTFGAGMNGTTPAFNWSSLVSAASIKTSASSDVLSHLRGGSGHGEGLRGTDGDSSEPVPISMSDVQVDEGGGDGVAAGSGHEEEGGGMNLESSADAACHQEDGVEAGGLASEPLSEDADLNDAAAFGKEACSSKKRRQRDAGVGRAAENAALEDSDLSSVSAADVEIPARPGWDAASATGGKATTREPLLKAARRGDTEAQLKVGLRFISGPAAKRNPARGLIWLKKAARAGSARAAFNIASLYSSGSASIMHDKQLALNDTLREAMAVRFLRKAVKLEYPAACYHLGARYLKGAGVEQNEERAVQLWRHAG